MTIKLGVVMDSIDHINIKKDTSFAMLLEAQARNWEIHYMQIDDLFLRNGRAFANTKQIKVKRDTTCWSQGLGQQSISLDMLDCIINYFPFLFEI